MRGLFDFECVGSIDWDFTKGDAMSAEDCERLLLMSQGLAKGKDGHLINEVTLIPEAFQQSSIQEAVKSQIQFVLQGIRSRLLGFENVGNKSHGWK